MAKVFVSYSRKDIEFAKRLTAELQKSDLDFWIDWEGIPPTVDWWKEIEKGIEEADVFLFLISPDSAKSKICGKEIDTAVKNGKRIIPIVVREIEWQDTPPQLGHLNYIFFSRDDDFDAAVKKLMTAIQTDYEWAATHRRLQVKALDWERNNKDNGFLLRGRDLQDAELDLATNSSKEPYPTDLQREYVFESRKATDRQRRITTSITTGGAVILAVLAIVAVVMAVRATRQANIALARQLAAQAQLLFATKNSNQMLGSLLAIQSLKVSPTGEGANFLLNNNYSARTIARLSHKGEVNSVAFSTDGKYIASSGCDKRAQIDVCVESSIHIWESATGREITHLILKSEVTSIAISPSGKYVVSGSCEASNLYEGCTVGLVYVWETITGREVAHMVHNDKVVSVAFSPNEKYVVSGSWDTTVRVWEATTGKKIAEMAHFDWVEGVAFSPDSKYVISGSWDANACVWEASTGNEVACILHDDEVLSVAFSSSGKYVVSGDHYGTAIVWEALTGDEVSRIAPDSAVESVAFSPDGNYIVVGDRNGTARVWEISRSTEVNRLTHDASVNSVAFSPDGNYVVSGSDDGTARVWVIYTGTEVARMSHDGAVNSVAFSPDGKYAVSGSNDGTARVWETTNSKEIIRVLRSGGIVRDVAFSPDGKYAASVFSTTDGESIHVWEISSEKDIAVIKQNDPSYFVAFSPDGKYVASGIGNKTVVVWDAFTGNEAARMIHDDVVTSLAFSPDGRYVLLGVQDGTAHVWEVSTGTEINQVNHDASVNSVAFSPDGRFIGSSSDDGTARVWDASTGKEVSRLTYGDVVYYATFSPNGKYIASTGCLAQNTEDSCIQDFVHVQEIASDREVIHIIDNESLGPVVFSTDNKYVVTGSSNGAVHVWAISNGKEISHMSHGGSVHFIAFTTNGKYMVSGSEDGTTRVWEVSTGQEIVRMIYDDNWADSVAFSLDDKYVVTWIGSIISFWMWQSEDVVKTACEVMPRNFTRAEWAQFIGDARPYQAVCENLPIDSEITLTPTAMP